MNPLEDPTEREIASVLTNTINDRWIAGVTELKLLHEALTRMLAAVDIVRGQPAPAGRAELETWADEAFAIALTWVQERGWETR
jgi:hypothetical protein